MKTNLKFLVMFMIFLKKNYYVFYEWKNEDEIISVDTKHIESRVSWFVILIDTLYYFYIECSGDDITNNNNHIDDWKWIW